MNSFGMKTKLTIVITSPRKKSFIPLEKNFPKEGFFEKLMLKHIPETRMNTEAIVLAIACQNAEEIPIDAIPK